MKAPRTKLVVAHRKRCYAIKSVADGAWATPWLLDNTPAIWLDAGGGNRSRGYRWLRFRCNCLDCPAILIAQEDQLCAAVLPVS